MSGFSSDIDLQSAKKLRPGCEIVEHNEGRLQLIFADHTATFTSPEVVGAVKALVGELQAAPPRDQAFDAVERAAAASGLGLGLVAHVFDLMNGSHCLYTPDPDDSREPIDCFFAAAGDNPAAMRERLSRTEIALVCSERASGPLRQAASAACLKIMPIEAIAGDQVGDVMARVAAACEAGAGLLGVFDFAGSGALARHINAFAIERTMPVLYADCRTALAELGPYVLPGTCGCLECLNLRKLSHANEAETSSMASRRQRLGMVVSEPQASHPAFLIAVANLFVCELADIAAAKPSRLLGSFIEMPQSGLLPSQHSYLRLPRCPSCGSQTPPRYAWNATFVSPDVKNEHNGT